MLFQASWRGQHLFSPPSIPRCALRASRWPACRAEATKHDTAGTCSSTSQVSLQQSTDLAGAECQPPDEPQTQEPPRRLADWPRKSDLYILRSDGMTCTRETVQACGSLSFSCPSSNQHLLVWKSRPKCVMLLKKLGDELRGQFLEVMAYLGEELGMRVLVEPHEFQQLEHLDIPYVDTFLEGDVPDLHSHVDFVACLGGDGLILHASLLFKQAIPPIISFNLGSLGFLTCHDFADYQEHLWDVVNGHQELPSCKLLTMDGAAVQGVYITLRMRLLCTIYRQGASSNEQYEVLNEVVVSRGANPFLTKIEVYEHDTLITKVQADGVMLATPTGSTAYNVAAGGSMVHPNVPGIMFTPICPHSLSFRPVILPDYSELEFRISDDARSPALVCLDGKVFTELQIGDSIHVRMSPNPVPTINNADQTTDWFNSIERCFRWNERMEQRRLVPPESTGTTVSFFASEGELSDEGPPSSPPPGRRSRRSGRGGGMGARPCPKDQSGAASSSSSGGGQGLGVKGGNGVAAVAAAMADRGAGGGLSGGGGSSAGHGWQQQGQQAEQGEGGARPPPLPPASPANQL